MQSSSPAGAGLARHERRVIVLVALVQFINVLDFVMVMPLGQDFARALSIDESQLGLVGGSYTLAAAVAGLVAARFLDRFDRRSALTVAMFGLVTATAAGGFAVGLGTMMAARVVAGCFGGPATSVSLAIIADVVPPERRGRAMSVVMAAFSVASVVGIPAGLAAAQAGSWRIPFFALAGLGVGVTIYAAGRLPSMRGHLGERTRARTSMWSLLRRPEIATMLTTVAIMMVALFMVVPNIRTFLENNHDYPADQVMYLYLAGGVASFFAVRYVGGMVDRFGSTPVATAGTALVTACLLIGFVPRHPIIPIMLLFVAFMSTASMRGVPMQALASKLPASHERAQYMSLQSACQHVAASVGAIGASQFLHIDEHHALVGMDTVVILAAALGLAVPFLMWRVERWVRRQPVAAAAPVVAAADPT